MTVTLVPIPFCNHVAWAHGYFVGRAELLLNAVLSLRAAGEIHRRLHKMWQITSNTGMKSTIKIWKHVTSKQKLKRRHAFHNWAPSPLSKRVRAGDSQGRKNIWKSEGLIFDLSVCLPFYLYVPDTASGHRVGIKYLQYSKLNRPRGPTGAMPLPPNGLPEQKTTVTFYSHGWKLRR